MAKIVMTGSAEDGPDWQAHIHHELRREALAIRFRDPADPFKIVIVRRLVVTVRSRKRGQRHDATRAGA